VQFGPNELPKGKKLHWWQLFLRQFKNPLIFILLVAGAITFWLAHYVDTIVISLAVLVNVVIGFWQEFRSNRIFEKLQAIVAARSRVYRNGKMREIDAKDLVPGDIILLYAGAKIPADARLISVRHLEVNEALLTGESLPVKKAVAGVAGTVALADRKNMVHAGTVAEQGDGVAVVVSTGENTELGQIAKLTASVKEESTPLQERLARLGKIIAFFVLAAAFLIVIVGIWEGKEFVEMFTVGIAIAVAAIPEGLPAALSVVLAVASQRIFGQKGLVKTLIGAETLGSTTVICTDKTGTLTEGIMRMEKLIETKDPVRSSLALAMANEAVIMENNEIKGEATDRAKLEYFLEKGGSLDEMLQQYPRRAFVPFDADEKYIASFHEEKNGLINIFVTGAPEVLIERSTLSKMEKERMREEANALAGQGYRMIAIAERSIRKETDIDPDDNAALRAEVKKLLLLGFAAVRDPVRPDVKESLKITRRAGIRVLMVTGDHKLTARAIGKELEFNDDPTAIVDGPELDLMPDEELAEQIKKVEIFSRASPKHKMRIISVLKAQEQVVAMTGDGVNDAPALKAADVGVSIGAGTDVTKEAADLVLLNDSFSTITSAIRQGRIAFDNMRKVTIFLLMGSFTEFVLIMASLMFRIPLPITAVQILWANIVEDGFPNFALAFEPGEKDIMSRPPLKRKEPILDRPGMAFVFIYGIVTDLILVGIFLGLFYNSSYALEHIRTIMLAAVATDALLLVFVLKNLREPLYKIKVFNNFYLFFAVLLGFAAMFAAIYAPPLQWLLGTVPLNMIDVALVLGLGFVKVGFAEGIKWWFRKKETPPRTLNVAAI
jgi:calcium-translocating P-type ATPase